MQKKLALSFLMAGFMSTGYTPSVQASSLINKTNGLIVASTALGLSVWQYITKKDVLKRYSLEELKAFQNIFKNLGYLYLDGFWGTPPKNDSSKFRA